MAATLRLLVTVLLIVALPRAAAAQADAQAPPDPDLALLPAEPDFTLGAPPTSLRMPAGRRLRAHASLLAADRRGRHHDFFADFGFNLRPERLARVPAVGRRPRAASRTAP
jgi:hypothetical protein